MFWLHIRTFSLRQFFWVPKNICFLWDFFFKIKFFSLQQKADRDRARASRALPPGKLATGKRTSAPKKWECFIVYAPELLKRDADVAVVTLIAWNTLILPIVVDLKNVICLLPLLHIFKWAFRLLWLWKQTIWTLIRLAQWSNQYEPLSDWPNGVINMNPYQTGPME